MRSNIQYFISENLAEELRQVRTQLGQLPQSDGEFFTNNFFKKNPDSFST